MASGVRKSIEELTQVFKSRGLYLLHPVNYQNAKSKLDCYDNEGYKYCIPLMNVKSIKKFARFEKANPYTIDNINLWLKLNEPEYELLSTEYKGSESALCFKVKSRPELEPYKASWHSFSQGYRHPFFTKEKISNSRRHSPKKVREIIEDILEKEYGNDWILNEGEEFVYKYTDDHLKFTHKDGYISKSSLSLLKEAMNKQNRKKSLELFNANFPEESMYNLTLWIKKNTPYKVEENQTYTKFKDSYIFICEKHGKFQKAFHSMYSYNTQCFKCYCDSVSGKGNPMYNHDLSDEERNDKRNTEEYIDWRNSVYKRDSYTCQCCNNSKNLIAHHLNGWHWAKNERTDINNGVTLCELCHSNFHSIYGYRNNTKEQFKEYINILKQTVG